MIRNLLLHLMILSSTLLLAAPTHTHQNQQFATGPLFPQSPTPVPILSPSLMNLWNNVGNGANRQINDLVIDNSGQVYAGGWFTSIGGNSINRVARWDGNSWHALGGGPSNNINAMAISPNGDLFIGGLFTTVDGMSANRVARWDGSNWHSLGTGLNGTVFDMDVAPNGDLFVVGSFTTAGGITVNQVARWDGSSWHSLSGGLSHSTLSPRGRSCRVAANGDLYVGGTFTSAGSVTGTNHIARWDGSNWHALGTGLNNQVYCIAIHPSNGSIYAGGIFSAGGSTSLNRMAIWNGSNWQSIGTSSPNNPPSSMAFDGNNNFYTGGAFTAIDGVSANRIAMWNGSYWSPLQAGVTGGGSFPSVNSIRVYGTTLYASGIFTIAGGTAGQYIAQFDLDQFLPVEWKYFRANAISQHVKLEWATLSETASDRFEIEKSFNGRSFSMIGQVVAAGESNTEQVYTYTDTQAGNGTIYYRLKQIDLDGSYTYSDIVQIDLPEAGVAFNVYPNPVEGQLNIRFSSTASIGTQIRLLNQYGQTMFHQALEATATNTVIPVANFPQGMYLLEVQQGQKSKQQKVFIN